MPSITIPIAHMNAWSGYEIANVSNLQSRRVYLEAGSLDTVVGANVVGQLYEQFETFVDGSNLEVLTLEGSEHTFPTDFESEYDNLCSEAVTPFISNCGYDGA